MNLCDTTLGAVGVGNFLQNTTLADIAENAPVGLILMSVDGVILWGNQAELELLGCARHELIGKNIAEFFADPSEGAKIAAQLAQGETLRDYQANLRTRDGSVRNVLISSNANIREGDSPRVLLHTQDITGRQRAEEERIRLTAQLEAANKEMESFSYSVSHDLRAPLRAMRGFTEVLLETHLAQLDHQGQEFLRRAFAASFQMERLIEDILKLAQVSRAELQIENIDLSKLAQDIASELSSADPARNVQFVIAPDCSACGDPRLVRLALDNLLRNSWKFSGKRDDARIEFGWANGGEPSFFVRDNGAGFDMARSKRLFGVFQRLHTTAEFPGTGVGLATVQRVFNRHGSRVWASGAVNEGATFYFTLPGMNHESDLIPQSK